MRREKNYSPPDVGVGGLPDSSIKPLYDGESAFVNELPDSSVEHFAVDGDGLPTLPEQFVEVLGSAESAIEMLGANGGDSLLRRGLNRLARITELRAGQTTLHAFRKKVAMVSLASSFLIPTTALSHDRGHGADGEVGSSGETDNGEDSEITHDNGVAYEASVDYTHDEVEKVVHVAKGILAELATEEERRNITALFDGLLASDVGANEQMGLIERTLRDANLWSVTYRDDIREHTAIAEALREDGDALFEAYLDIASIETRQAILRELARLELNNAKLHDGMVVDFSHVLLNDEVSFDESHQKKMWHAMFRVELTAKNGGGYEATVRDVTPAPSGGDIGIETSFTVGG